MQNDSIIEIMELTILSSVVFEGHVTNHVH